MKRLLSLLLAIAMVISMIPNAFAETAEETQTEASALTEDIVPLAEESTEPEQSADLVEQAEYAATGGDYTYNVSDGEATITGYTGNGGDITIPSALDGYPVTTIGDNAFYNCDSLTSVTIPDSVSTIGASAFSGCSSLTSITIPDSVTTIGNYAFSDCRSLTSVTIGDSVTTIGASAFYGCDSLTSVTIPDSVTTIGEFAFATCTSLTRVTIGDSVTSIGNSAFSGCDSLTRVTIGDSVTSIGNSAFYGCDSLTSVTIPDSVTSIGNSAFSDCTSLTRLIIADGSKTVTNVMVICRRQLTDVSIPNSVTTIGNSAFRFCSQLTNVTIPDSVTSIGNSAFSGCDSLTSVTIPDSVTSIGDDAFFDCTSLTSITIPDSVTSIGESAFACCDSLTSVTIGDSVTSIGDYAFNSCDSLTDVTIPDSVTTIGSAAFSGCSSLTDVYYGGTEEQWNAIGISSYNTRLTNATIHFAEVEAPDAADYEYTVENGEATITGYTGAGGDITIPSKLGGYPVIAIGDYAFWDCDSLTSVIIPNGLTTIGEMAFYYNDSLTSVVIPASVTQIEDYVVVGCFNLTGIWVDKDNAVYSSDSHGVLFNRDKTELILAPWGLSGSYAIPDGVTTICADAFDCCNKLTAVTIPASVIINKSSFISCNNLTGIWVNENNVAYSNDIQGVLFNKDKTKLVRAPGAIFGEYVIPDSVTNIDNGAFWGCDNLSGVIIPDSVTNLGECAFYNCDNLSFANIGNGITTIGLYTFFNCKSLTSVVIPSSVTTIGEYAFCNCTNLTSVIIPNGVSSICECAFGDCDNLTSITIPNSVIAIGYDIFYGCDRLSDVYYGGTEEQWNEIDVDDNNDHLLNANIHFVSQGNHQASNGEETFTTLQAALDAYETGTIQLLADVGSVAVSKNAVVDLNGFSIGFVTVTAGELTVLDTKTDDYTIADGDYGKIAAISGAIKSADGYIAIAEADGTSYHKVTLETTDMTLRSADVGVYYNCAFSGDELLASQVTSYGVALSIKGVPEIGLTGTACSVFYDFEAGSNTPSTLLKNVLKETNTAAQNNRNADMQVYGRAYIQIGDSYIYGETVSRSFREQVELADTIWSTLTTQQQTAVQEMYRTFRDSMEAWTIPNIKSSI